MRKVQEYVWMGVSGELCELCRFLGQSPDEVIESHTNCKGELEKGRVVLVVTE